MAAAVGFPDRGISCAAALFCREGGQVLCGQRIEGLRLAIDGISGAVDIGHADAARAEAQHARRGVVLVRIHRGGDAAEALSELGVLARARHIAAEERRKEAVRARAFADEKPLRVFDAHLGDMPHDVSERAGESGLRAARLVHHRVAAEEDVRLRDAHELHRRESADALRVPEHDRPVLLREVAREVAFVRAFVVRAVQPLHPLAVIPRQPPDGPYPGSNHFAHGDFSASAARIRRSTSFGFMPL